MFARRRLSFATATPISAAVKSFSEPPKRPIGVRTAAVRKTGFMEKLFGNVKLCRDVSIAADASRNCHQRRELPRRCRRRKIDPRNYQPASRLVHVAGWPIAD